MKIKQGRVVPDTVLGFGYIFLLLYLYWLYSSNGYVLFSPLSYILPLFFLMIQFTVKDFSVDIHEPAFFTVRIRFLGLIVWSRKQAFEQYAYFIIRMVSKTYNVKRGIGLSAVLSDGRYQEKYLTILGYNASTKEMEELCKGSQNELNQIVSKCILPKKQIYFGVAKKGYEYMPKS